MFNFMNKSEIQISKLKAMFLAKIFSDDHSTLKSIVKDLEIVNSSYSLIVFILTNDQINSSNFLKTNKIELDLILYLIKHNFCIEFAISHLNTIKIKDYLYFLCLKELLIKNIIDIDIEKLLDKLDDYDIYQYCVDNKIRLKERDTINYQYYKIHIKEFDNVNTLLERVKSYKDIEYIINLTGISVHPECKINNIVNFIKNGYNQEFCKSMLNDANSFLSLYDVKLVLANLIASKNNHNLVLALYVSKKYLLVFSDNYDIDLIYLFLLKYFLFYEEILDMFKKLDIKNNQLLNMSYIWSDAYIILNKKNKLKNKDMKDTYISYINEVKTTLMSSLSAFIESNKISHALNIINLYKSLQNNTILKELEINNFIKTETESQFKNFLGSRCCYLFEKTVEVTDISLIGDFFENEVNKDIDEKFKKWFTNNWKTYHE